MVAPPYSQRHSSTNKVQPNLFCDFFQGLEIWHAIFCGLILDQRFFWVLLEALGVFWGLDFCPPFNHPGHLKSGIPPIGLHSSVKNSKVLLRGLFMYEANKSPLFAAGYL